MTYCKNCGVELDEIMNFCPLCGEPASSDAEVKKEHREFRRLQQEERIISDYKGLTKTQKRKLFWELSTIILGSGIVVSLIIDLVLNQNITWSRFPITVCIGIFLNITCIAFLQKRISL